MRIDTVRITNYGGIRHAEVSTLAEHSVITVTGRNGTGKSLLLEAIAQVLVDRGPVESRVGPWGTQYEVLLIVVFDAMEQKAAAEWLDRRNSSEARKVTDRVELGIQGHSNDLRQLGDEWAWSLLRDEGFREAHPFVDLSFLPAVRAVRGDAEGSLELDSLDPERVRRSREEGIERALTRGGAPPHPYCGESTHRSALLGPAGRTRGTPGRRTSTHRRGLRGNNRQDDRSSEGRCCLGSTFRGYTRRWRQALGQRP